MRADTFTTQLKLTQPAVGASTDTWRTKLNNDLGDLEAVFSSTGTSVAMNLDGAVIDSSVIGGTTPAAGTFTTLTANTSITGTLATAAQPNITSVGTLTGLTVAKGSVGTVGSFSGDDASGARALEIIASTTTNVGDTHTLNAKSTTGILKLATNNDTARMGVFSTGIGFYEDTGTTLKLFWNASDERLGIGTSSPARQFHLHNASGDNNLHITNNTTGATASDGFSIVSQSGSNSVILNQRESSNLIFHTGNVERARIDSSGNLLVGTTNSGLSSSSSATGINLIPNGASTFARSGGAVLYANRISTDGNIIQLRKDGTTVGSIGISGVDLIIDSPVTDSALALQWDDGGTTRKLQGYQTAFRMNTANDAAVDLGASNSRFKDLYLSGGAYVGGTAAANKLDDYEEGTWTPTITAYSGTNPTVSMTASGTYVKIGRFVTINVVMDSINVTGTKTGLSMISGLPFTVDSTGSGSWVANEVTMARPNQSTPHALGTGLGFLSANNGGGWSWENNNIYPSSGTGAMRITFPYFTNQ